MEDKLVKYILTHMVDQKNYNEINEYLRYKYERLEAAIQYCVSNYKEDIVAQIEKDIVRLSKVKDFQKEHDNEGVLANAYLISELVKDNQGVYINTMNSMKTILENFYGFYDGLKLKEKIKNKNKFYFFNILYEFSKVSDEYDSLVYQVLKMDSYIYECFIRGYKFSEAKYDWLLEHLEKGELERNYLVKRLIERQELGPNGREGYNRTFQKQCKETLMKYVKDKSEEELIELHFRDKIGTIEMVIWSYAMKEGKCKKLRGDMQSAFNDLYSETTFCYLDKESLLFLKEAIKEKNMDLKGFESWNFDYKGDIVTHLFSISTLLFDELQEAKNIVLATLSGKSSGSCVLESWPQHTLNVFLEIRKELLGINPKESLEELLNYEINPSYLYLQMWGGYLENSKVISSNILSESPFSKEQAIIRESLKRSEAYKVAMKNFEYLDFLKIAIEYLDYRDAEEMVMLLQHKQKKITNYIETVIVKDKEAYAVYIQEVLENGKKRPKEIAGRILKTWENEKFLQPDFCFDEVTLEQYVKNNNDTTQDKLLSNIPESLFKGAIYKQSEKPVPDKIIRFLVKEYLLLKEVYRIGLCDKALAIMDMASVREIFKKIYQHWLDNGAIAKEKNKLLPYVVYMDIDGVVPFKKQLVEWNAESRGAIAAFGVGALAMNGSDLALMQVSSISKKFKNKKVRSEATIALEKAAEVLGISKDVLEDRIISNLGFDQKGEMMLSYGERSFMIRLSPELTIEITDIQRDKIIKNLPKPGQKDDEVIAKESKKHLSDIKKQLKEIVKIQKQRLESVMMNGRKWEKEGWYNLFAKNPIMHNFATGLIWGVYDEENNLIISLRYMDDGTFNTIDEEEYELNKTDKLTLIHPCEISEELRQQWRECLDDYEIVQPITQMGLPVFELDNGIKESIRLKQHDKLTTTYGKVLGMKSKYGWQASVPKDGGGLEFFYILEDSLDLEIFFILDMNYEGFYVGASPEETGGIDGVYFAEKNVINPIDYFEKEKLEKKAYKIGEVRPRIVQMTLYQLSFLV